MAAPPLEASPACEALFESPYLAVALLDRDLRFVRANRAYGTLARCAREDLPGLAHFALFPHTETEQRFRHVLETGARYEIREMSFESLDRGEPPAKYWDGSLDPVRGADGEVIALVLQLLDVTDHVVARRLAAEREVLLRELHHRVKNNLQIIGGLLRDAKRKHPEVGAAFDSTLGRIATIAHIHDLVGADRDLGSVDLGRYAEAIASELRSLHDRFDVRIAIEGACVAPVDLAGPLGMILHELLCNALAHAFPERSGTVTVVVRQTDARYELEVCDDGVGLPERRRSESQDSIGLELVGGLVRQLDGQFEAHALTPRGTCCHIYVPIPRPPARSGRASRRSTLPPSRDPGACREARPESPPRASRRST